MKNNDINQENEFIKTSWKLKRSMNWFRRTIKKENGKILSNGSFNLKLFNEVLKARR